MRRREFITLVGSAAAWPLARMAQQPARMRRIGVLVAGIAEPFRNQPDALRTRVSKNWAGATDAISRSTIAGRDGNLDLMRASAKELVGLEPDRHRGA